MTIKTTLSLISLALLATTVQAEEQETEAAKVTTIVTMGYGFGGDDAGELEYEDGTSASVSTGGGFTIGGGLDIPLTEKLSFSKPIGVRLTANYQFDSATASNADITFDRFAFNIMPYVMLNDKLFASAGVGFHTGVEWSAEQDGYGSETLEYDGATAFIVELGYQYSEQLSWSARLTSVDYTPSKYNGVDLSGWDVDTTSGNNLAVFLTYRFSQE